MAENSIKWVINLSSERDYGYEAAGRTGMG